MVIHYSGNDLSVLAKKLSDCLQENMPADPLVPHTVIVPNRDTAKWLQFRLSEYSGIAANLNFLLPAEWHWTCVRTIYPDLPKVLPSDPEPMKWSLFEILNDPQKLKQFDPLWRYLSAQSEEMRESAALKLSRQIASLFDQYLVYRPGLILKWDEGDSGTGDEQWQAGLWRLLTERWSRLDEPLSLHKAKLFEITSEAFKNDHPGSDGPIFLFNAGLIPGSILEFLKIYSERCDIHLFQNYPSQQVKAPYSCSLLESLGEETAGVHQLCTQLADRSVNLNEGTPGRLTLLDAVRERITGDLPDSPLQAPADRESVQIRSCHSALREAEVLHQYLLEQFEKNPDLNPNDILVVTPDLSAYENVIEAVFGTKEEGLPAIPYRTPRSGYREASQIHHAFLDFLNLITSRFEYRDVMSLFLSKPVLNACGLNDAETRQIRSWLDDNYIIWGIDPDHRKEWDQPAQFTHTWKRAIDRIWLGDLLGPESGINAGFARYHGVQSVKDRERLALFSRFFNFVTNAKREADCRQSASGWCDMLLNWAIALFTEMQMEQEGQRLSAAIEALREHFEASGVQSELSFRLVRTDVERILTQSGGRSARFTDGVTFSTMVPVRGLPFKIIAMIGLNEETFPRKQTAPDFDLMARDPKPTERDRKKEDKALFLESVLSAGEIHYCSYIGQSKVDNEKLPPSPIVSEWIDYLSGLTGTKPEDWVRHEALTGFSPSSFRDYRLYSDIYYRAMESIAGMNPDSDGGLKLTQDSVDGSAVKEIQLNDLIRFYTAHPDWFLKNRFDARVREPEEERKEFQADSLEEHIAFRQIFDWKLRGLTPDIIREWILQSGILPEGWAGEKALTGLLTGTDSIISRLHELKLKPFNNIMGIHINLADSVIVGSVESYSKGDPVQVNPSTLGGKNLFKAWLNHLALEVSSGGDFSGSYLIGEAKKGDPVIYKFTPAGNAAEILSGYAELCLESGMKPLRFFPDTVWEYLTEREKKGEETALNRARKKFEGDHFAPYAERDRLSVKLLYGPEFDFGESLIDERFLEWMSAMKNCMEEL